MSAGGESQLPHGFALVFSDARSLVSAAVPNHASYLLWSGGKCLVGWPSASDAGLTLWMGISLEARSLRLGWQGRAIGLPVPAPSWLGGTMLAACPGTPTSRLDQCLLVPPWWLHLTLCERHARSPRSRPPTCPVASLLRLLSSPQRSEVEAKGPRMSGSRDRATKWSDRVSSS